MSKSMLVYEEQFNRFVERLRPRRLSDAEHAERDRARQAAHDKLALKEAKNAEVEQRVGYREIEAQHESAIDAVLGAEYEVMEAKPATPAGTIALLRFVAELIAPLGCDDEDEHYAMAIRNVADFFERSGLGLSKKHHSALAKKRLRASRALASFSAARACQTIVPALCPAQRLRLSSN